MSQIYKPLTSSGPIPPVIATSYATDLEDLTVGPAPAALGSVVPQSNILRIAGDNGIKSVETSNPGDLQIRFIRGSETTSDGDGQTQTVITQAILNNATMTIQIIVAGYSTDNLGIGAYGTAVVKNVAGTASLINTVDLIVNKDAGVGELGSANVTVTTLGANLLINVVGVAGKTITWTACLPGIVTSS